MNVLQIVQEFCGKKTLPVPTAVIGSTDTGVVQIRYMLNEVCRDLSEYSWQEQRGISTFVTVATQIQGFLSTLLPGYLALIPGTMWDLSANKPIFGPVSEQQWAALQVLSMGPEYQYIVLGNQLLFSPTPVAGLTIEAAYQSYYTARGFVDAYPTKEFFTLDTDVLVFPDNVVLKLLDVKWKYQKGEPWEVDAAAFANLLPKKIAKDTAPTLNMGTSDRGLRPGIWVPSGNWPTA